MDGLIVYTHTHAHEPSSQIQMLNDSEITMPPSEQRLAQVMMHMDVKGHDLLQF